MNASITASELKSALTGGELPLVIDVRKPPALGRSAAARRAEEDHPAGCALRARAARGLEHRLRAGPALCLREDCVVHGVLAPRERARFSFNN